MTNEVFVKISGAQDICFSCDDFVSVSELDHEYSRFSGDRLGRDQESVYAVLSIYKVAGPKDTFVGVKRWHKVIGDIPVIEDDTTIAGWRKTENNGEWFIFKNGTAHKVIKFFGWGDTAKELYRQAKESLGIQVDDCCDLRVNNSDN